MKKSHFVAYEAYPYGAFDGKLLYLHSSLYGFWYGGKRKYNSTRSTCKQPQEYNGGDSKRKVCCNRVSPKLKKIIEFYFSIIYIYHFLYIESVAIAVSVKSPRTPF